MAYEQESCSCPHCGKKAVNKQEVKEKFGYRKMANGRIIVQSWCKECR